MILRQLAAAVALAAATFLATVPHAEAARAFITATVNLRSGPGSEYRVIDRLHRGDRVEITHCTQSRRWCHIERRRGRDGWVSSRFLTHRGGGGGQHWGGGGHGGGQNRPGSICFHGAHGHICITP